jgi:hypothetical protein
MLYDATFCRSTHDSLFSWRPWDILFGKCAGIMDGMAMQTEANFARASGQLRARPPDFCQHAAKNYLNKKMKMPIKNLRNYATHVLNKYCPSTGSNMKGSLAHTIWSLGSSCTLSTIRACSASSLKLMASSSSPFLHRWQFRQSTHL